VSGTYYTYGQSVLGMVGVVNDNDVALITVFASVMTSMQQFYCNLLATE